MLLILGEIGGCYCGVFVFIDVGKVIIYLIMFIEECGMIFVNLGIEVYEGMIIGENFCENDLIVNIIKVK